MPRSLQRKSSKLERIGSNELSRQSPPKPSLSNILYWKFASESSFSVGQNRTATDPASPTVRGQNASGTGTRLQQMRDVEAVLFLSREPISVRKLKQLANLSDLNQTRTLVTLLNHYFDTTGRAFRVESVAGGYLLMTRPELASWLRRIVPGKQQIRLSSPTMETLVVVAYRQPVMRAEIDGVRGVNCGEILRQLMEMDLVRISGRSEELGRPYLYSTTNRFLKFFGLNNLDELPKTKSMLKISEDEIPDPDSSEDPVSLQIASEDEFSDEADSEEFDSEILETDDLEEELSD